MLDLQKRQVLQRRCVPGNPYEQCTCFSWGSMAALPEGRVAVGSREKGGSGASVTVFDMGMAGAELEITGAQERAVQAPRTVLHTQPRHANECGPIFAHVMSAHLP